jgi:hypothetical protein
MGDTDDDLSLPEHPQQSGPADLEDPVDTAGAISSNIDRVKSPNGTVRYSEHDHAQIVTTTDTLLTDLSLYGGNVYEGQTYGHLPVHPPPSSSPSSPSPPSHDQSPPQPLSRWQRSVIGRTWLQGKGMLMVVVSQFFGASMNVMTQILERDGAHGKAMHPFQVRLNDE